MPNNAIDDEQCEALRRQGASKEKAARLNDGDLVNPLRNH